MNETAENQNQPQSTAEPKAKKPISKIILWVVVALVIGVVGYIGTKNTDLFRASLTMVGNTTNTDSMLYIPNNYLANSPESANTVEIKVGCNPHETTGACQGLGAGNQLKSIYAEFPFDSNEITFNTSNAIDLSGTDFGTEGATALASIPGPDNDTLVISIISTTAVDISVNETVFKLKLAIPSGLVASHQIDITNPVLVATDQTDSPLSISSIAAGRITISGTGDEACGDLDCGDHGACNPVTNICDCNTGFRGLVCNECDEGYTGYPDCVVDVFGHLEDIVLSLPSAPALDPVLGYILHPTDSFGMEALASFDDATPDTLLNLRDVTWVAEPLNVLNDAALVAGRLEKGDASGTAEVFAEVEKADGTFVRSNTLTVTVPSGPIVEYARIIGADAIVKGDRVSLTVKITDVDQISDIEDIRSSIVRTDESTYGAIDGDSGAIWFTAAPFMDDVEITDSGTTEGGGEAPADHSFRIYTIPVEVPQDSNLTDGLYKLVLSITDMSNFTANTVIPISIGAVASGDVNGDGNITMIDVIMAFQIVGGTYTPTAAETQAADLDGISGVTMIDVMNLYNQVNQ